VPGARTGNRMWTKRESGKAVNQKNIKGEKKERRKRQKGERSRKKYRGAYKREKEKKDFRPSKIYTETDRSVPLILLKMGRDEVKRKKRKNKDVDVGEGWGDIRIQNC